MNKIDLKRLTQYIEEGWIEFQDHPSLPLRIYNYSRNCQFEEYWDDLTLMCRGLVLDHDGNIVARPFRKFFNLEESKHTPTTDFDVYEKMDGSLGILFYYDEWLLATRGSFTSEQSIKGKEMLNKYSTEKLDKNKTYLFEIIY
jgi:RNA ligase